MALPLVGGVLPMAGGAANAIVPLLRAAPVVLPAVPMAGAGGVIGAAAAVTLPLVAAFGVGFAIGTGLLALWNALNQALQQTPVNGFGFDQSVWPSPKPGQTLFLHITVQQKWPSDPAWESFTGFVTREGRPFIDEVQANAFGPGLDGVWWRPHPGAERTGPNKPVRFVLTFWNTDDGLDPILSTTSGGFAPSRAPLVNQLAVPLAFVPPADPLAPAVAPPPPTRREDPKAPPIPGTPAPAPARVTPAPGGAPGRTPGGVPLLPGTSPAQLPGRVPIGDPSKAPAPATMPTYDPARPPQPTTPAGPVLMPGPVRPPVTAPGSTFLPGGVELPDNGPRPTPEGIATELGKLEKKLEIALAPEGPLSLLQQINRAIDQLDHISFRLDPLFPAEPYTFAAGQYQLAPVCDLDSEGVLLTPRVAPWAGGEGEVVEVRRKLDALAQLLQHHKDLKQPTCGGRVNGPASNVTVHFESD